VLKSRQTVIVVNGCFWHRHQGCKRATTPATNTQYWSRKLEGNIRRDKRAARQLRQQGRRVITIWECEVRDAPRLRRRLFRLFPIGEGEWDE